MKETDKPITFSGHMRLSSPEVLVCKRDHRPIEYTYASDVFMFAMSMYEVTHGYEEDRVWPRVPTRILIALLPLLHIRYSQGEDHRWRKVRQVTGIMDIRPPLRQKKINLKFLKLMQECWEHDPKKRPTFSQVVKRLEEIQNERPKPQETKQKERVGEKHFGRTFQTTIQFAKQIVLLFEMSCQNAYLYNRNLVLVRLVAICT